MTQITNLGAEKIILGIDPGTRYLGYGLIRITRDKVHVLQYGVLNLTKYTTQGAKFLKIHERIVGIVEEFFPDEIAIEFPTLELVELFKLDHSHKPVKGFFQILFNLSSLFL